MTLQLRPQTILIVDDDPDIVEFLDVLLKGEGLLTLKAYSGHDGLQKAQEELPDLILLDVVMPHLNGFQVCRTLKNAPKTSNIPVVFVTAKDQPSDRFWGEEVGAVAYLVKPINRRKLTEIVNRILGRENAVL